MATNMIAFNSVGDVARLNPFRKIDDILHNFSTMAPPRIVRGTLQIRMEASNANRAYVGRADGSKATRERLI